MYNFRMLNSMYDKFIDSKELTTKELVELGFNNHDIAKLVEEGKIRRVRRGYYDLVECDGLFKYANVLFSKRVFNVERGKKALERCLEIDPTNGSVHTRLFNSALYSRDYDKVFEHFQVLDNKDKENYKKDLNLWLYLLSFITDVPEEYLSRVKNMQVSDVLTLSTDVRYADKINQNLFRNSVIGNRLGEAEAVFSNSVEAKEKNKKIYTLITEKLLKDAIVCNSKKHDLIYTLIIKGYYHDAKSILEKESELHGLAGTDQFMLTIINDMIGLIEDGEIPCIEERKDKELGTYIDDVIRRHDYRRALELYNNYCVGDNSLNSKYLGIMLERINAEIYKAELVSEYDNKEYTLEEMLPLEENVVVLEIKTGENINNSIFVDITNSLLNQDIDKAFELIDKYLNDIGKSQYKGYIIDLIKLGLLDKDKAFIDAMSQLSAIGRDKEIFDVSVYIQDFYFSLVNKDFKKAEIYLDILSMSKELGNIDINISDMRVALEEEIKRYGELNKKYGLDKSCVEDISISDKIDNVEGNKVVENVGEEISVEKVLDEGSCKKIEEVTDEQGKEVDDEKLDYTLADVIDDVLNNSNVVMLEPMSSDECREVLNTVKRFDTIRVSVIDEEDGKKRIVLRYVDRNLPYVDIGATLKKANNCYNNWQYENAIDLYQTVLPKIEEPRSFIYAKLGFAYQKTTYDGDYSKAIDYLTLAQEQSKKEDVVRDYSKLIEELKTKSKYNGKVLTKK